MAIRVIKICSIIFFAYIEMQKYQFTFILYLAHKFNKPLPISVSVNIHKIETKQELDYLTNNRWAYRHQPQSIFYFLD